jgi:hypothetical protein
MSLLPHVRFPRAAFSPISSAHLGELDTVGEPAPDHRPHRSRKGPPAFGETSITKLVVGSALKSAELFRPLSGEEGAVALLAVLCAGRACGRCEVYFG